VITYSVRQLFTIGVPQNLNTVMALRAPVKFIVVASKSITHSHDSASVL